MLRRMAPAVLALALLAGCGGDEGDGGDGGARAGGSPGAVEGTGYSTDAPSGWEDKTGQAEELGSGGVEPDVVLIAEREEGFTANINVLRQPGLGEDAEVAGLVEQSLEQLRNPELTAQAGLSPEDISEVTGVDLDGEEARSFDYSSEQQGRDLRFRQVYAVRDGSGYIITFTGLEDRFEEDVEALAEVVTSWHWE